MSELSQTSRSPCSRYPKTGKVCWTYLSHVGLSDGGGVQDQAGQEQTRQRVIHQLQTSNQLTYKSISLDDIKKVPTTEQLTTALLNSSYNLWRNLSKTGDSNCWICFPFSTL